MFKKWKYTNINKRCYKGLKMFFLCELYLSKTSIFNNLKLFIDNNNFYNKCSFRWFTIKLIFNEY